jgi:hypothetical protein
MATMPRPRRHDSNKARVDAYRQRHAGRRRLELFVDHEAIERLDALAQAHSKSRSEIIEGLLLKTSSVSVNVTGDDSAARYLQEVVKPAIKALLPLGLSLSDMARRLDEQGIRPSLKPRGSGKWYSPREGRQGKGGGGAPYLKKVMVKLGLWGGANPLP